MICLNKRKLVIGAVSVAVLVIALAMALGWTDSLGEACGYLREANVLILLLLIPDIWLMFYAAGRIWYPYLKSYGLSAGELGKIQYELHFINTVVPVAALSGLVYATERLKPYGITAGYAGGMYVYRYIVSVVTNWIGIIGAVIILGITGHLNEMPAAPLIFVAVMIGVMALVLVVLLAALTGKARVTNAKVRQYLDELHKALTLAKADKRALASSWLWGMLYTILEDLPFLLVAWAMGHPELFLQMVVAAAAGAIVGSLIPTPGGIGGFDGAMIYLLGGFSVSIALASTVVMTTRILILLGTITTSYFFWQRGMVKIGRTI